ncbi:MAG: hypothetical protein ABSA93_39775 [Streptosporangiaceae bacterium]|jgi:hypothetical protein
MPEINEDVLRGLLRRSTEDLHAPTAVTASILKRHRRRRVRTRVLSVATTGAAAGLVAGVMVAGHRTAGNAATPATGIQLTAAQKMLYKLSKAAAATSQQTGRYVVLHDRQTTPYVGRVQSSVVISVIDTANGSAVAYQNWPAEPGFPKPPTQLTEPAGTFLTEAQYKAMTTNPAALRAMLLSEAEQQFTGEPTKKAYPKPKEQETSDDLVFEQATNYLWNPLLTPTLRAAIYKVLAATPGVVVKSGATDSAGQPAVEISRFDSAAQADYATFENPSTGTTLETLVTNSNGVYYRDLYQSITYTNSIPANPYGS